MCGFLSRASPACNVRATLCCHAPAAQAFPACGNLRGCFANYSSLAEWDSCLEQTVHANLHGLHGGQLGCSLDLAETFSDMPCVSRAGGAVRAVPAPSFVLTPARVPAFFRSLTPARAGCR